MVTVAVNGRTVVHRRSGGVSLAFPDVCLTPPGNIPIPYLNIAFSRDSAATSATVYCDGEPIMLRCSYFSASSGDEAGTGGGVISGRFRGKASFSNYSFDVSVEGEPVPRAFDPMVHNHGSPPNALSPAILQGTAVGAPEVAFLCVLFCFCVIAGKTRCMQRYLSVPHDGAFDPLLPGIYLEVAYDMSATPPRPLYKGARSRFWRDYKGDSLPLPTSAPIGKTRRPDLVIVDNPGLGPYGSNIKAVVEFKFPGDRLRRGQRNAYERIAGSPDKFIVLTFERCACGPPRQKEPQPVPVPTPQPQPVPQPDPWPVPGGEEEPEPEGEDEEDEDESPPALPEPRPFPIPPVKEPEEVPDRCVPIIRFLAGALGAAGI